MLIVDRNKLKFLLAGRSVQVDATREYKKGRDYAVGVNHRRSLCRATVEDSFALNDATWRLTIRQHSQEQPRLLAANPGGIRSDYTSELQKAVQGEPEALTDAQLREVAKFRPALDHERRSRPVRDIVDGLVLDLDEALRTSSSRDEREKLRAARHHLSRIRNLP